MTWIASVKNRRIESDHHRWSGWFKADHFSNRFESPQQLQRLLLLMLLMTTILLVSSIFLIQHVQKRYHVDQKMMALTILNQQFMSESLEILRSDSLQNRKNLSATHQQFQNDLAEIASDTSAYQRVMTDWQALSHSIERIQADPDLARQVQFLHLSMQLSMPEIQSNYAQLIELLQHQPADIGHLKLAQQQEQSASQLLKWGHSPILPEQATPQTVHDFIEDTQQFRAGILRQLLGDPVQGLNAVQDPLQRALLQDIQLEFDSALQPKIERVLLQPDQVEQLWQAYWQLPKQSEQLLQSLDRLAKSQNNMFAILLTSVVVIALLGLAYATWQLMRLSMRKVADTAQQLESAYETSQHQHAILRLLNEISDFAEGDLRRPATVSEDFTGTIADALNLMLQQYRHLIDSVQRSVTELDQARLTLLHAEQIATHLTHHAQHSGQTETTEMSGSDTKGQQLGLYLQQLNAIIKELELAISGYQLEMTE